METKTREREAVEAPKPPTSAAEQVALPTEIQAPLDEVAALRQELRKERERADEQHRRLLYLQADFENYRKRVEKEMGEVRVSGVENLVASLVTVLDELELALLAASKTAGARHIVSGVEMVFKKLRGTLEKEGLAEIEAVGRPFDSTLHDAATRVETKEHPNGTILEEIRKGYTFRGRLLRPSLVKVAVAPKESRQEPEPHEGEAE